MACSTDRWPAGSGVHHPTPCSILWTRHTEPRGEKPGSLWADSCVGEKVKGSLCHTHPFQSAFAWRNYTDSATPRSSPSSQYAFGFTRCPRKRVCSRLCFAQQGAQGWMYATFLIIVQKHKACISLKKFCVCYLTYTIFVTLFCTKIWNTIIKFRPLDSTKTEQKSLPREAPHQPHFLRTEVITAWVWYLSSLALFLFKCYITYQLLHILFTSTSFWNV